MSKIMILRTGKVESFDIKEIPDDKVGLAYLQKEVGGYIEIPYICKELNDKGIDMVINEEGKINELEPTIAVLKGEEMIDVIVGTVVFCGHNDDGESVGLNDLQVKSIEKILKDTVVIGNSNEEVAWEVRALNV